jgi:hypothetical protein
MAPTALPGLCLDFLDTNWAIGLRLRRQRTGVQTLQASTGSLTIISNALAHCHAVGFAR